MTRGQPAVALALIALGSHLAGGCEATLPPFPPIPRDPAGPCLQLIFGHLGRDSYATLWRGDTLVGHNLVAGDLDAPLIAATSDNSAAAAEARASHRSHVAFTTILIAGAATTAALAATGSWWSKSHETGTQYWLGGATAVALAATISAMFLYRTVGPDHRNNAIEIYNANPPPGCGAPPPDAVEASE